MRLTILISLLAAGVFRAQDAGGGPPPGPEVSGIECYCTDRSGARVELGQTICLMVDGRAYLARCEMSLNVPAWRDTGSECVGARLGRGLRPGQEQGAMARPAPADGSGAGGGA